MVAGKNYNIQTVRKKLPTKSSQVAIGTVVPTGMTRYVTLVNVQQDGGAVTTGSRVLLLSAAAAHTVTCSMATASGIQKLSVRLVSGLASANVAKTIQVPGTSDTENPLFSIAAGAYLIGKLGSSVAGTTAPAELFVQYYDQ